MSSRDLLSTRRKKVKKSTCFLAAASYTRITPSLCNSAAWWASASLGEQLTRAGVGALLGRDSKARTSRLRCFLAAFKPLSFFPFFPVAPGRPILLVNKSHRLLLAVSVAVKKRRGERKEGTANPGTGPGQQPDATKDGRTGRRHDGAEAVRSSITGPSPSPAGKKRRKAPSLPGLASRSGPAWAACSCLCLDAHQDYWVEDLFFSSSSGTALSSLSVVWLYDM